MILPKTIPLRTVETFLATIYHQRNCAKTTYQRRNAIRDIAVIELLFSTGIRISELCSLNVNDVNFSEMFLKSQKTFKNIWKNDLENRYTKRMAWNSIMNFPSGYAVSAKNLMLALDRKNVDVRYKYVYGKGTPFPVEEPESGDNYIANIIRQRKFDKSIPQVVYGQGDVFYRNDGKYKIGYTMLETTGIPKEWVKQCNMMEEVWVPSHFNEETFRDSGVKVPIHVIPLGIDPSYYSPNIVSYKNHDKYTFLSVFEWGERKAPEIL